MPDRQPTLTGDLVHLRPLRESDFPALLAVSSDPEIWSLHPAHDRWREPVFRRFFDRGMADGGTLAILDRATGELIGCTSYGPHEPDRDRIEIGWTFLARSHWGGPVNREIKRLMLAHILPQVPTEIFRVGEHNHRSRRALEKIGAYLTAETDMVDVGGRSTGHVFSSIDRVPL